MINNIEYRVGYRYTEGQSVYPGYYFLAKYNSIIKAKKHIKKLKTQSILKTMKDLNITEIQTKSLELNIYTLKKGKGNEQLIEENDEDTIR